MNHRTSGEKMKCFMNPTQWFVLGQKEKNITFLKSNLFQWKKLSIEFFFIIFLALETCLVAVSIGNCTFCFWGEITCGSVDWHKLAYRRNVSLTKKWKWEFVFFADGRPQVEEIWILDSFCTKTHFWTFAARVCGLRFSSLRIFIRVLTWTTEMEKIYFSNR